MITDGPEAADSHEVLHHDAVLARAFFWSNPLFKKKTVIAAAMSILSLPYSLDFP